jgi:hypothetical protein
MPTILNIDDLEKQMKKIAPLKKKRLSVTAT